MKTAFSHGLLLMLEVNRVFDFSHLLRSVSENFFPMFLFLMSQEEGRGKCLVTNFLIPLNKKNIRM